MKNQLNLKTDSPLDTINDFIYLMQSTGVGIDVEADENGNISILFESYPHPPIFNNPNPTNHENYFDLETLYRNTEDLYQSEINEFSPMQNNVLGDERERISE
jgi:hypothetical protein